MVVYNDLSVCLTLAHFIERMCFLCKYIPAQIVAAPPIYGLTLE